jgi:hypothetical protein
MSKKPVLASGLSRDRFPVGEHRETVLNQICPSARKRFPYYFKLPYQDPIALLKWRVYARKRCVKDKAFRAAVWEACRRDFAFFAVTFLWIFEPRPNPRRLPFTLWTDQVSLAAWFCEIFGVRDGAVNKTRGIGLSVLVAAFIYWKWTFEPEVKIAVLTKDRDLLDSADFNSSLGKLQYFYDNMPEWAKYAKNGRKLLNRTSEKHFFQNQGNGALVQGFVSTSTKLRQLRFTWLFADEFAFYERTDQAEWMTASGGTCNARLLVSTWNDFDDEFHRIFFDEESSLLKMSAYWWNNYERWRGAYKMEAGRAVLIDKEYPHPPDYQFGEPGLLDDGTIRSPWVDAELSRPGVDRIKTLRDLFGMSVCERTNSFFSGEVRSALAQTIRTPDKQGIPHTNNGKVELEPTQKSTLRLWGGVPERNRGPYTMFCDLGGGANQAYSVACVLDKAGEQVLEYGNNTEDLTSFTNTTCHLARWLAGVEGDGWVLIDAEANGQFIRIFVAEMQRLAYGNLWYSQIADDKARRRRERMGEIPKYIGTVNRDKGLSNFRELARAIMAMDVLIRSERVMEDLKRCSKDDDSLPKFAKPTALTGHGDFLHAAAGAWWRMRSIVDLDSRDETATDGMVEYKREDWVPKTELWSDQYT